MAVIQQPNIGSSILGLPYFRQISILGYLALVELNTISYSTSQALDFHFCLGSHLHPRVL